MEQEELITPAEPTTEIRISDTIDLVAQLNYKPMYFVSEGECSHWKNTGPLLKSGPRKSRIEKAREEMKKRNLRC